MNKNDQKNQKSEATGAVPMDTASASSLGGGSGASKGGAGASGGGGGPATLSFREEVRAVYDRMEGKIGSYSGDIDDIKGGIDDIKNGILEITEGANKNTDRLIEKLGDVGTQMETHILDGVEDKLVVVSCGDRGHVTREHGKTRDWTARLAVTDMTAVWGGVIVGLFAAAGAAWGFNPWCQGNLVALGFMSLAGGSIPGTLVCAGINRYRVAKLLPAATVNPSRTAAAATPTATVASSAPAPVTPPASVANPATA